MTKPNQISHNQQAREIARIKKMQADAQTDTTPIADYSRAPMALLQVRAKQGDAQATAEIQRRRNR